MANVLGLLVSLPRRKYPIKKLNFNQELHGIFPWCSLYYYNKSETYNPRSSSEIGIDLK